ncbi:E3 ubiquitin-protein ligase TRIM39 [Electrophorus electricus]|uniref:E3 ubiquitin-protein ligase TRIM39 n=1 Tax=Electrophorus electricus TaxID=8005 RepID=UPI0015CFB795|nr:E3 ubiquitin-protein ligase TRIM39 [Electrophorus electricus]
MTAVPVESLSEVQFSCSICLDIFANPVSTPCGHSFCLACITSYWDSRSKAWLCPLCKETFRKRPELHVNHTLKEITEQFKRMAGSSGAAGGAAGPLQSPSSPEKRPRGLARPGELPGRLLTEMKNRFQRGSSSENLLESSPLPPQPPPYSALQRRCSPSAFSAGGSAGPQCASHGLVLDMFCRTDQTCVCAVCLEHEHYGHSVVPASREMNIKKSQLGIVEAEVQGLIAAREKKIEEIQNTMTDIQANAQQEVEVTLSMFRILVSAVDRTQAEMLEVVEVGRVAAELRSQALIKDLQLEIDELRKRSDTIAQLARSNDHFNFFRTYPSLCSVPQMKTWKSVTLTPDPTAGAVLRNVTQMVDSLQEVLKGLRQTCLDSAMNSPGLQQLQMQKLQEYALDVTLDRDSAHPRLLISEDCKKVHCSDRYYAVADIPERFDRVVCVLGQQGFSSGRHYWEVQVGEKTDWDLGVASRSINRKGKISVCPANGYWFLSLRDKHEYVFRTDPPTPISINLKPQKIAIYVDYESGQVSFYNADNNTDIFTYTDSFTDVLYPFFSPCTNKSGKNYDPLIICPVNQAY